ncbi:MAG: Mur ligase family protein, partial [Acidimicrobiales bacterium]
DGPPTGVVGTLSGTHTTPEATELQARLAEHLREGCSAVAMEVSSHALDQHRVDATWFAVAVFTNLSQDHLDYHGDMERYFRAKAALFSPERAATAVVNADDPYGRLLLDSARVPTRPFSLDEAVDLEVGSWGSSFRLDGQRTRLAIGGSHNVLNALAAAAAARELGVPPAAVSEGLSAVSSIPGRWEAVEEGQAFTVLVDYAHTPAALEAVLHAARPPAGSRLLVVFGCGGDRDATKRPAMGEVASRMTDLAVLTSDNPRHEEPGAIIAEVLSGVADADHVRIEPDRRAAIELAFGHARPGDVVVIAGKGHETTQDLGNHVEDFDDRETARNALRALSR